MKIYVVGEDATVTNWLRSRKHDVMEIKNPIAVAEELPDPDLVVFTGGADVWPGLYGKKNTASSIDLKRDLKEVLWFHRFYNVQKLGICRGGQFLNVMSGGSMEQDIPGHAIGGYHKYFCRIATGIFNVTSTHHQAMKRGPNATIVGVGKNDSVNECLYYSHSYSLCFQPHPEYSPDDPANNTIQVLNTAMKCFFKRVV